MWRLAVLAVLAGLVVAIKLLPWWGSVALLVGLVVAGKLLGGRLLEALFTLPFKAKGRVLRGAAAEVHAVSPAEAPADPPPGEADEDAGDGGDGDSATDAMGQPLRGFPRPLPEPRRWYTLEVTVRPDPAALKPGGFTIWEPGELVLVRPSASDPRDDDDAATVHHLEIQRDGVFVTDDGMKLPGPQRLRMLVGVEPGVARLRFRYYFELFGEVTLS